jgi:hypothetical protein
MWSMRFDYDSANDVVSASFSDCVLNEKADVDRWEREVSRRLGTFGRKVDLLIDLSGLTVKPAVSALFGEARARVLSRYALRSFRYGADRSTRTSIFTSAAIYGAEANVFDTRDSALGALLEARKER